MDAVDLSSMNEKQKAKEFKALAKALKSKDLAVKDPAVAKLLADKRYLFEGGCLRPLLDTLLPKKGAQEPCRANAIAIASALSSLDSEEFQRLLNEYFAANESSFASFQTLTNLIAYKEEIKLPKPKKGEPQEVQIPPENENVIVFRGKAIEALGMFCRAVDIIGSDELKSAFLQIPNFLASTMAALALIHSNLSKEEELKKRAIEEAKVLLSVVTRSIQFVPSSGFMDSFLVTDWVNLFSGFLAVEELYLSTLLAVRVVSRHSAGLKIVSESGLLSHVYNLLGAISSKMEAFNVPKEAAPPVDAKGKAAPKKDDKKKGAAEAAPVEDPDKDLKNYCVACAKYTGEILRLSFEYKSAIPDEETSAHLSNNLLSLIKNSALPAICRQNESKVEGVTINDTLNFLCGAVGSLATISEACRSTVSSCDIIKVLVELLQTSAAVIGITAEQPNEHLKGDLSRFRSHLEKSILSIISSPILSVNPDTEVSNLRQNAPAYWPNSIMYITHATNIESNISFLLEMAVQTNDSDLSDRAMRLLAFIIYTVQDQAAAVSSFKLDSAFVSKLSHFIQSRATSTLEGLKNVGIEGTAVVLSSNEENLSSMSADHALYYGLLILNILLGHSADMVNAFCNKDRVIVLRDILYFSGPTVVNASNTLEYKINLRNTWNYNWEFADETSGNNHIPDSPYIRPIIIDAFTKVCESFKLYRTFEGEIPSLPAKEPIKSTYKTYDSSLIAARFASDAVLSILLTHVSFGIFSEHLLLEKRSKAVFNEIYGRDYYWNEEIYQLLASSLNFIVAVSHFGAIGSYAVLESVSDSAKASSSVSNSPCTLSSLNWVHRIDQASLHEHSLPSIDSYTWSRSLFFDDFFKLNESASRINSIVNNSISWPYITLVLALLCVVSDDSLPSSLSSLAVDAIQNFCVDKAFHVNSQPVVCDILAAVLLSFGGISILSGYHGKFGRLTLESEEKNVAGVDFIMYLLDRGSSRQKFWTQWKEDQIASLPIDPKTGKPIPPKKDDKKKDDKKKDDKKGAVPAVIIVEEVKYNVEPDESNVDPNHGPSKEFWLKVIDNNAHDNYNVVNLSSGLISAIHGSLSNVAFYLIDAGVNINHQESNGRVALMLAFLFGESEIAEKLVAVSANLDVIDHAGNPLIKYAFSTLSKETLSRMIDDNSNRFRTEKFSSGKYYGFDSLFYFLQSTKVDVSVPDEKGNFPVHYAVGLCELEIEVAGSKYLIKHDSYDQDWANVEASVKNLVAMHADINSCNKVGITPLHVTAMKGDITLTRYLLHIKAKPNVTDNYGYLPLHYVASCCPTSAVDLFNILFEATSHRPVQASSFHSNRSTMSVSEKVSFDVESAFSDIFSSELQPATLFERRASPKAILSLRTSIENYSIFHICMAHSNLFHNVDNANHFSQDKYSRIKLVLHLIKLCRNLNIFEEIVGDYYGQNFSILHAASAMLNGVSPQVSLPEREVKERKVSRRVTAEDKLNRQRDIHSRRKFTSEEAEMVDAIMEASSPDVFDARSTQAIAGLSNIVQSWTPSHAAVFNDNHILFQTLSKCNQSFPVDILTFLVQLSTASVATVQSVIELVLSSGQDFGINSIHRIAGRETTLLHFAVITRNINFILVASEKLQFDMNYVLESTKSSAFADACFSGDAESRILAVKAFESAKGRLDLLAQLFNGVNCIEHALNTKNFEILNILISYRPNDILQVVLNDSNKDSSILLMLELEQIELVKQLYGEKSYNSSTDNLFQTDVKFEVESRVEVFQCDDVWSSGVIVAYNAEENNYDVLLDGNNEVTTGLDGSLMRPLKVVADINATLSPELMNALEGNYQILQLILPLVNESNLISCNAHAHRCFFDNVMYRDI